MLQINKPDCSVFYVDKKFRRKYMFGIDSYGFEVCWPSLLGMLMMTGAMVWGSAKVIQLTMEESLQK
ncbi:MAG: hypothetical protein ACKVJ2_01010 [Pseudomonadales bacterium]